MKRIIFAQFFILFLLLLPVSCANNKTEKQINDFRPDILKKLDGEWIAKGKVMGENVEYNLTVRPVLNFTFSELHMIDVASPPQYEAMVFIGYDTASKKIISHWLDSFGPAFSIPHGTGNIDSNTIEFIIPYTDGTFRDRITLNDQEKTWSLLIESFKDSTSWNTFAEYYISKKTTKK
jgi:hypothetical protein